MTFTGNDLLLLAVVPVVLAALTWFLLRIEAGMAVRGMAENMDRARLLGIPVNQLSLLLWSVAGGLAALTVVLRAPTRACRSRRRRSHGAAPGAGGRGDRRACVAVGRLRGRRRLGVLDQLVLWNVDNAASHLRRAARRHRHRPCCCSAARATGPTRASRRGRWSASATACRGPTPACPRSASPSSCWAACSRSACWRCRSLGTDSQVNFGTVTLVYGMVAVSLVVLTGWGGVVSLGQVASWASARS